MPLPSLTVLARRACSVTQLPEFQAAGVARASRIMDQYRGVLIADPTGAGKTYMALALIEESLERGIDPVLVTSPAALRGVWLDHVRRLRREQAGRVLDAGTRLPKETEEWVRLSEPRPAPGTMAGGATRTPKGPTLDWLSHTALSLGRWPDRLEQPSLVVVDEAHAFRNPRTRRYRALARLCRSARVILLTATPVHNSLLDLYFQLRLFLTDDGLADLGVPDLRHAFLRASAWPGPLPESLAEGIGRISIRRSRKEIEDRLRLGPDPAGLSGKTGIGDGFTQTGGGFPGGFPDLPGGTATFPAASLRFPRREPPRVVPWNPGKVLAVACDAIEALDLLPFRLGEKGGTGSELMRFHLLKRLESSAAAFGDSLARLMRYFESFLDSLEQGFLLRPDDRRALTRADSDAQLFLAPLALRPLPARFDRPAVARSVAIDLEALCGLEARMRQAAETGDPKISALDRLLSDELADSPVLVFTEFRTTAVELWRRLGRRHRTGLIHGAAAWLGISRTSRSEVVGAFAPRSNGTVAPAAARVRVLIATDVLAEGWNLQDARDVVSFDLPWNPVRLIQRVGRIDRLGSLHATVRCHNFMPDHYLDDILRLVERLADKLDAIRSTIGEPGVLDPLAPSAFDAATRGAAFIRRVRAGDQTALAGLDDIAAEAVQPHAATGVAHSSPSYDGDFDAPLATSAGPATLPAGTTLTPPGAPPGIQRTPPGHVRPCRAADRLRRRLLRLLVLEPGGAGDALCRRADRVLELLATPQRIGVEFELEVIDREFRRATAGAATGAPRPASCGAADLIGRLESISCAVSDDRIPDDVIAGRE